MKINTSIIISTIALITSILAPALQLIISLFRDMLANKNDQKNKEENIIREAFHYFIFHSHYYVYSKSSLANKSYIDLSKYLTACSILLANINNPHTINSLEHIRNKVILTENFTDEYFSTEFTALIKAISEELDI